MPPFVIYFCLGNGRRYISGVILLVGVDVDKHTGVDIMDELGFQDCTVSAFLAERCDGCELRLVNRRYCC